MSSQSARRFKIGDLGVSRQVIECNLILFSSVIDCSLLFYYVGEVKRGYSDVAKFLRHPTVSQS